MSFWVDKENSPSLLFLYFCESFDLAMGCNKREMKYCDFFFVLFQRQ
jgi:hypothetical protein